MLTVLDDRSWVPDNLITLTETWSPETGSVVSVFRYIHATGAWELVEDAYEAMRLRFWDGCNARLKKIERRAWERWSLEGGAQWRDKHMEAKWELV